MNLVLNDFYNINQKKDYLRIYGELQNKDEKNIPLIEQYDFKINETPKNLIFSSNIKVTKKSSTNFVFEYYIRYENENNFAKFSIRNGQEIAVTLRVSGIYRINTGFIKITKENLFSKGFYLTVSVFEDSLDVIIDKMQVLSINEISETTGNFFWVIKSDNQYNNLTDKITNKTQKNQTQETISLSSENKNKTNINNNNVEEKNIDIEFDDIVISDNTLHFEPIINIEKNPDVYFMQANIFYEQDNYDLALFYYKKGLLYGKGDDKIYNRVGNLQFLIENYKSAEFYYKLALEISPDNLEYKKNYLRSLIKLGEINISEIEKEIEKFDPALKENMELFIDYSGLLIKKKDFDKAFQYLDKMKDFANDNVGFMTKYGRLLVEKGNIDEGREYLLNGARELIKYDPSSSIIVLKFLINRSPDEKTLLLLTEILHKYDEHQTIVEVLEEYKEKINLNSEIYYYYVYALNIIGKYESVVNEISKINENIINSKILFEKLKALIEVGNYDEAFKIVEILYNDKNFYSQNINEFTYQIFKLSNRSKVLPENIDELINCCDKNANNYDKVLIEYSKVLVDIQQYEKAIDILEKYHNKYFDDLELLYNLGICYNSIGRYLDSKNLLLKVYNVVKEPNLIFLLANSFYYCNEYKNALNTLLDNIELFENDAKVFNLLGNIYLSLDDINNAQKSYYKALEIDEDNEEYALNLAESFYRMKDYKNAYKITSQIIKEGNFDRAMALHIKLKNHIFIPIQCSKCGEKWEVIKDEYINNNKIILEKNEKKSIKPVGFCKKCGKIYCEKCVFNVNNKYICPDDKEELLRYENSTGIKIQIEDIDEY